MDDHDDDDIAASRHLEMIDTMWKDEEFRNLYLTACNDVALLMNDSDDGSPLADWLRLFVRKHGIKLAREGLRLQRLCHRLCTNDSRLKELDLRRLGPLIGSDAVQLVANSSLQNGNTVLRSVDLSGTLSPKNYKLGPNDMQLLAQGLQQCASLETLFVEGNKIGDEGVSAICDLLLFNNNNSHDQISLKTLDVCNNGITCNGAKSLALALKQSNCTLSDLGLSNNDIRDEGAIAMCNAIQTNTRLTSLNMQQQGNRISEKTQLDLLEALSHNNFYLEHFFFSDAMSAKEMRSKRDWLLDLNKAGRRLLRQQSKVPQAIWPRVLAKINDRPELIHYFLCENPSLVMTNSHERE